MCKVFVGEFSNVKHKLQKDNILNEKWNVIYTHTNTYIYIHMSVCFVCVFCVCALSIMKYWRCFKHTLTWWLSSCFMQFYWLLSHNRQFIQLGHFGFKSKAASAFLLHRYFHALSKQVLIYTQKSQFYSIKLRHWTQQVKMCAVVFDILWCHVILKCRRDDGEGRDGEQCCLRVKWPAVKYAQVHQHMEWILVLYKMAYTYLMFVRFVV